MHHSHIPQCPMCNKNVHMCEHFCYKMVHCGILVKCIMGCVRWPLSIHWVRRRLNSSPLTKWRENNRDLQAQFRQWKLVYIDNICIEICSLCVYIGLDNGLVPIRRQAIIQNNVDAVQRHRRRVNVVSRKVWKPRDFGLTHWGRVTHVCVSKPTTIGSDNGLSPGRRQAIIWTNAGILLIGPLGTNFSEIVIEIQTFSFKKIHLKMSSGKWRPSWPQCVNMIVSLWNLKGASAASGRSRDSKPESRDSEISWDWTTIRLIV